jgi:phosphatidylserine decarboxylase
MLLTPIHQDGWPFVAIFLAAAAILFMLWQPLGWLGLAATGWCAYFFRNPERVTPQREGLIISACDGVIQDIGSEVPPATLDMPAEPVMRVGVFLSLLDVHIARAPMPGTVAKLSYTPGRFHSAASARGMDENERMAVRLARDGKPDLAVVLIAGQVARRIRCGLTVGDRLRTGERIGLIRFGSRVEVYLPPGVAPLVCVGQHVIAGETVLADETSTETARQGETI